jgi:hypothetical protein
MPMVASTAARAVEAHGTTDRSTAAISRCNGWLDSASPRLTREALRSSARNARICVCNPSFLRRESCGHNGDTATTIATSRRHQCPRIQQTRKRWRANRTQRGSPRVWSPGSRGPSKSTRSSNELGSCAAPFSTPPARPLSCSDPLSPVCLTSWRSAVSARPSGARKGNHPLQRHVRPSLKCDRAIRDRTRVDSPGIAAPRMWRTPTQDRR